MKAIKAKFENGRVTLEEAPPVEASDVLVIFPEPEEDPWDRMLANPRSSPALEKRLAEVQQEFVEGKTRPLSPDDL